MTQPGESYSPAQLEEMVRGWERILAGGLNGSSYLLVVCPQCSAVVTREGAPRHRLWHNNLEPYDLSALDPEGK